MSKVRQKIAVVIPCYNESRAIGTLVTSLLGLNSLAHNLQLEVYVIDNNSSDQTAALAQAAGAQVIAEPHQGKGNALRTGFAALPADTDFVVMLDGDATYSPHELLRLVAPLQRNIADAVIGCRLSRRPPRSAMCRRNLLGNRLFTQAVRVLYGANVTDVLSGYFAWKKSTLDALLPHITSSGFAIEMEMITKMAKLDFNLMSVPITYRPRQGNSNLHPWRDGWRIARMLVRNLRWQAPARHKHRKIIFVSDTIYPYMKGGKEKRLHEISRRLAASGREVHIYTMHWWPEASPTQHAHGVYFHALCKQHQMYKGDRRTISEALYFSLACLKLWRVRFDVIDVDHMPFFPVFTTWLICTLRRKKLYATWHEALSPQDWRDYMGLGGLLAFAIERLSIKLPYQITAASAQTKDLLAATHGRIQGVALVSSGIDVAMLKSVKPADVQCDVLYAGRLVKDKHVDMLVIAMKVLRQRRPDARCIIIGDGPEKQRLQRLIRQHHLAQQVRIWPPLPHAADVYGIMKATKVFCLPSVREGFGIVTLEALGCGTPVVTIDNPANAARHLIQPGSNGSLVPLDASAIADALENWIISPAKPAFQTNLQHTDWSKLAQQQAEVYGV